MHETQMRAALHHFVGGHRGVESSGEQAHEAACGVRREAAWTEDAARVDEQWPAGDFDAAGERGRFQVDAHLAAFCLQLVKEIAADLALNSHGVQWKALVAAAGAYGKGGELLGADFLPGGIAKGVEWIVTQGRAAQNARDGQVRNAADAGQALQTLFHLRGVGNFDDQAVGGPGDAADGDAVQRAAQRFSQFVEEETAIAALEPQLVVVNDNVRRRHHSRWPSQADARSIPPPASRIAGNVWRTDA